MDLTVVEGEARSARRDGFRAKAVIHPNHVAPVNAAFAPTGLPFRLRFALKANPEPAILEVLRALGGPGVQLLMTAGRQGVATPVYLASIVALVVANLVLIPPLGLAGAGLAVFAVTALWVVWLAVLTRRELGFSGVGL